MEDNKVLPGMAKRMFIRALVTEIAMRTYDPSMNPKDLINTTLTANKMVEKLIQLMDCASPYNTDDFEAIAKTLVTTIKNINNLMEGE